MLAYYGSPRAEGGKPALLEALKSADDSDRPQIVWSLVTLRESSVFKEAMGLYRAGVLAKVERLGGGAAFDAELLAGLVPPRTSSASSRQSECKRAAACGHRGVA